MSLRKFERLVRAVRPLHCGLTREFFTAVVRGTLIKR
jgi:hypothetical protein